MRRVIADPFAVIFTDNFVSNHVLARALACGDSDVSQVGAEFGAELSVGHSIIELLGLRPEADSAVA
jgi:3-isopropylmalate dehydratase small subunit